MKQEVWTGLVNVIPIATEDRFFRGANGAYVNVLAWAASRSEYLARVRLGLKEYCLNVRINELKNVGPLSNYNVSAKPKLLRLAEEVKKKRAVRFGTFHMYQGKRSR